MKNKIVFSDRVGDKEVEVIFEAIKSSIDNKVWNLYMTVKELQAGFLKHSTELIDRDFKTKEEAMEQAKDMLEEIKREIEVEKEELRREEEV